MTKICFVLLAVIVVAVPFAKQSVDANNARQSAIQVWENDPARMNDCTQEARDIEHLYMVFSVTESGKAEHSVDDAYICVYDDGTYDEFVKNAGVKDFRKVFGTWTEDKSGSVFLTQNGSSGSYEIKR